MQEVSQAEHSGAQQTPACTSGRPDWHQVGGLGGGEGGGGGGGQGGKGGSGDGGGLGASEGGLGGAGGRSQSVRSVLRRNCSAWLGLGLGSGLG